MSSASTPIKVGLFGSQQICNLNSTPIAILQQPAIQGRLWITCIYNSMILTAVDITLFGSGGLLLKHYSAYGPSQGPLPLIIPCLYPNDSVNLTIDYPDGNLTVASDVALNNVVFRAFIIPANASTANIYAMDSIQENILNNGITVSSPLHVTSGMDVKGLMQIQPLTSTVNFANPLGLTYSSASCSAKKSANTVQLSFVVNVTCALGIAKGEFVLANLTDTTFKAVDYVTANVLLTNVANVAEQATVFINPTNGNTIMLKTFSSFGLGEVKKLTGSLIYLI